MHSATKYLNGHSDVLAGALIAKDRSAAHWAAVKSARVLNGAVLGAFEAWLLLSGLRMWFLFAFSGRATRRCVWRRPKERTRRCSRFCTRGSLRIRGTRSRGGRQSAAAYDPDAAERDGEEGGSEGGR